MIEILLAITCMILIGTFWRKILPVAAICLVLGGLFLLILNAQNHGSIGTQAATDPVVDQCIKAKNATWDGSLAQQTLDIIECTTAKKN